MLPWESRRLWTRSFSTAWLLIVLVSGAAFAQIEPDPASDAEKLRKFLKGLTLDAAALQGIDEIIAKLDSDRFAERSLASMKLARLPVLPRQHLEEAMAGASPDKRFRIGQILQINTAERTDAMILSVVEKVAKEKISGLLPEILAALEGRDLDAGWKACVEACEATAAEGDLEVARSSIASETALVRAGAAVALIKIARKGAIESVEPLVSDPEDRIKLIAANYLRSQENRACMIAYAALLTSENFGASFDSRDALQDLTGKEFGFFASADDDTRLAAIAKWKQWIKENGADAALDFTIEAPVEIVLFNGSDLEGWKEVKGIFRQPEEAQAGWGVEDGALICYGNSRGHLRTRAAYKDYLLKLEYRTPDGRG